MAEVTQILLDLDGPLLDGKQRHYFCYRNIMKKYGFEPISIDQYWKLKRRKFGSSELLKLSGAEAIYDDFRYEWIKIIESPAALALDMLQPGVAACLQGWKDNKIRLILVTMRKNKIGLEQQLDILGLRVFLDRILVCDHAAGGAGKAAAVLDMWSSDNIMVRDAVWIGDTEADWQAAKVLGCPVILVSNGLRSQEYLMSLDGALIKPGIGLLKIYNL